MLTSLKRVLKSGWLGFWRNKWLSSAAILTMSLAIFGVTSLLLANVLIGSLSTRLEEKIDVSVYFHLDTPEEEILDVRGELVKLNEVKTVEYTSADDAIEKFKKKHADNQVLMQSLSELGTNPLEASLNIKARQPSQYAAIVSFFEQEEYQEMIDKINYLENKTVIERLASITRGIRQIGIIVFTILAGLGVLVTFNTIRLTIYSARKEIRVMKLVGASNWFTWGPFVVEGALYGVLASVITVIIIYPLLWYISPAITNYLPGTDLFYFFRSNFLALFMIQLGVGIGLGSISSWIAVKRYSNV